MEEKVNDILYRIIALGDSGVGKTSILRRFAQGTFDEECLSTIGISFSFKEVKVKDGANIKIKCIDTAGQEKYRALGKNYYKNAEGILFVFSLDNEESFNHIEEWIQLFNDNGGDIKDKPTFLIGNKSDIIQRKIEQKSIEDLKNKIKFKHYKEISAKSNLGIEDLFKELTELMYEKNKKYMEMKQQNITLENDKQNRLDKEMKKNKKKCCLPV